MFNPFKRLLCLLLWHDYYLIKELGWAARQVGCRRCSRKWAVHYPSETFVPWSKDIEALYSTSSRRTPSKWP